MYGQPAWGAVLSPEERGLGLWKCDMLLLIRHGDTNSQLKVLLSCSYFIYTHTHTNFNRYNRTENVKNWCHGCAQIGINKIITSYLSHYHQMYILREVCYDNMWLNIYSVRLYTKIKSLSTMQSCEMKAITFLTWEINYSNYTGRFFVHNCM